MNDESGRACSHTTGRRTPFVGCETGFASSTCKLCLHCLIRLKMVDIIDGLVTLISRDSFESHLCIFFCCLRKENVDVLCVLPNANVEPAAPPLCLQSVFISVKAIFNKCLINTVRGKES